MKKKSKIINLLLICVILTAYDNGNIVAYIISGKINYLNYARY